MTLFFVLNYFSDHVLLYVRAQMLIVFVRFPFLSSLFFSYYMRVLLTYLYRTTSHTHTCTFNLKQHVFNVPSLPMRDFPILDSTRCTF
jgi:hypothetical protein